MKKTLLFLLLALASSTAAFAQARPGGSLSSKDYTGGKSTESGNTGFGVKAGYNFSRPYGDGVSNATAYNGFAAGLYGQFGFDNFSSVLVELLYTRKGYSSDTNIANSGSSPVAANGTKLDYVELPVLYVANLTNNFSIHVGPQVSLLINAKQGDKSYDLKASGFNSVDYGGIVGAAYRIGPAQLGARYDLSFGKIYDTSKSYNGTTLPPVHNQVVQLYVALGLRQ